MGEGSWGGMNWKFVINRYKLSYRKLIKNKVLLYNTGTYIQYPTISHNGKEYEKNMHIKLNHFAAH